MTVTTPPEALPRDRLTDASGMVTRAWRNYFENRTRRLGEVLSGLGWGATASEADASNSLVRLPGVNRLRYTTFSRGVPDAYWERSLFRPSDVTEFRLYPGQLDSATAFECTWNAYSGGGACAALSSETSVTGAVPVYPGEKLAVGFKAGMYGAGNIDSYISFYTSSGSDAGGQVQLPVVSAAVGRWVLSAGFATVPSTAAFARIVHFFNGVSGGGGAAYIAEQYIIAVSSDTTVQPVFTHGADNDTNADPTIATLPPNVSVSQAATFNPIYPLSSSSTTSISVAATTITLPGRTITTGSATITGLSAGTIYTVFRDLTNNTFVAISTGSSSYFASLTQYVSFGSQSTQTGGGGYTEPPTPPPGGGGGWNGRGAEP